MALKKNKLEIKKKNLSRILALSEEQGKKSNHGKNFHQLNYNFTEMGSVNFGQIPPMFSVCVTWKA